MVNNKAVLKCKIQKVNKISLSTVYPKLAFNPDNLDDVIVINRSSDIDSIPEDIYLLAEPLSYGWGTLYDGIQGTWKDGSIVVSYEGLGVPPLIEDVPGLWRTFTGSVGDGSFIYDGEITGFELLEEVRPQLGCNGNATLSNGNIVQVIEGWNFGDNEVPVI